MFGIYIGAGVFIGIMIPTILISAMSGITIKILELFNFYKRGNLYAEVSDYITGAGIHRTAKVYMGLNKNGSYEIANGKVFGYLVLIFLPLSIIFSIILFFLNG
jgi:hypothetical protein